RPVVALCIHATSRDTAGQCDLVFTVPAGGEVDVLPLPLEVPAPETTGDPAEATRPMQILLLIGAAAAGFGVAVVLVPFIRRRPATPAPGVAHPLFCAGVVAPERHWHGGPTAPAGRVAPR